MDARNKLESGTGSVTIEGETYDKENNKNIIYRHNITSADYLPNPVAYSTILQFDDAVAKVMNPDGKKIGYMVYLSFESDFDEENHKYFGSSKFGGLFFYRLRCRQKCK